MYLLKDLCATGIYDWLAHKGSLVLGKSAEGFGLAVDDGDVLVGHTRLDETVE